MLLVLTGEGPSDLGIGMAPAGFCSGADFKVGPMALLIDRVMSAQLGYSILRDTPDCVTYASKDRLKDKTDALKQNKKSVSLIGKKKGQETGYFVKNAWAFGLIALDLEKSAGDVGVAVFFRDSDGTQSSQGSAWSDKWASIEQGFSRAGYPRGVPMLAKPTSEAWLLCAAKKQPYQNCEPLEDLPGNMTSPNHPKDKLDEAFGHHKTAVELCEWLDDQPFDVDRACAMGSFSRFKVRLEEVLQAARKAPLGGAGDE